MLMRTGPGNSLIESLLLYIYQKVHGICTAWRSVKQGITALSTYLAEYVAMSICARALERILNLLINIFEALSMAQVWGDKHPAIIWAEKGGIRTKHLDVRFHYVRDQLEEDLLPIDYSDGPDAG